jgi:titin
LLLLLLSQAVLAQYEPTGPVTLSSTTPTAGGQLTVSGDGFAPGSQVQVIIESEPVLLATVTTDAAGSFTVDVTIPTSFSGEHLIVATGIDPAGSVRVLGTTIVVAALQVPPTSTSVVDATPQGSDAVVLALAGAGIVAMTGSLLLATRRRGSVV